MKWNSRWIATDKTTVLFTALESTSNTTGFCKITRKQEKQHINYILKCAHKFERKENKYFCREKHYWCKIWGSRAAFSFCLTKPCPIAAGNPSQAHSKTKLHCGRKSLLSPGAFHHWQRDTWYFQQETPPQCLPVTSTPCSPACPTIWPTLPIGVWLRTQNSKDAATRARAAAHSHTNQQ